MRRKQAKTDINPAHGELPRPIPNIDAKTPLERADALLPRSTYRRYPSAHVERLRPLVFRSAIRHGSLLNVSIDLCANTQVEGLEKHAHHTYIEIILSLRDEREVIHGLEIRSPVGVAGFELRVSERAGVDTELCLAVFRIHEFVRHAEVAGHRRGARRAVVQEEAGVEVDICVEGFAWLDGGSVVGAGGAAGAGGDGEGGEGSVYGGGEGGVDVWGSGCAQDFDGLSDGEE
jgi:hypothetical protein